MNLKQLIEDTYVQNNNTAVIMLAHSMGGLMSLYFLNCQPQSWKDKYIKSLVTLSAVWGGSMKAIKVYAIGKNRIYVHFFLDDCQHSFIQFI